MADRTHDVFYRFNRRRTRILAAALFVCAFLLYNEGVTALGDAEPELPAAALSSAKAAYVLDMTTGRTLFSWNADEKLPMASTTKVMTALLALERGDLSSIVTASRNAYGIPGTSIYLAIGERLTLHDMLYGLMLASGNDAAVAIAEHIGGSVDGFLAMMNERAGQIGAFNTRFNSPNGLPVSDHYTTAYDLARIARVAMRIPTFREIVSTQRATIPWMDHDYDRVLTNKNRLLSEYEGATGIKTGFTNAAGRCLVFGAKRGDMEILGVVLNCSDWFDEAERLMNMCFGQYTMTKMLSDGDAVRPLTVRNGIGGTVPLRLKGDLEAPLSKNESVNVRLDLPDELRAPVNAGDTIGYARLYAGDALVSERPIVAAASVEARSFLGAVRLIMRQWLLLS
ncbi:MAG: D-alanyl-D-alanine carboxypeptidase [Oscillospiraceae bacterium]|jgi:D-alanyl-D-alanine carboxypeptidase (penicillin-binding protein 5/6)|nr:D-alanyl-D-alanine carboxypeptidase [Oscillospiraceae bacterium]